ncbi:hypothetical protein GCM10020000_03980 [Streptomyces olivoverticillatus]
MPEVRWGPHTQHPRCGWGGGPHRGWFADGRRRPSRSVRYEHRGAGDLVRGEVGERRVGPAQRIALYVDHRWALGDFGEVGASVGPGVGGDAAQGAFLEEVLLIVEGRNVREVDA